MKKPSLFAVTAIIWAVLIILGIFCAVLTMDDVAPKKGVPQEASMPVVTTEVMIVEQEVPARPYYHDIANAMTEDDMDLVAKITYLEAGNQSMVGQRAVVEVIFNRVQSPLFPDTIQEVIYQKNPVQFTTSQFIERANPTDKQYEAIRLTLEENIPMLDPEVLYFSTGGGRSIFEKIGDHYFCF